ncbi:hypothetical protein GCM10009099_27360 [Caenispirillum bisanense]
MSGVWRRCRFWLDPVSRQLFVSANPQCRDGRPGLYRVSAEALHGSGGTLALTAAADLGKPHGIGLDVERRELAVIDHAERDSDHQSIVRRFLIADDGSLTAAGTYGYVRNANDVVADGAGGVYVTQNLEATSILGQLWELARKETLGRVHRLPPAGDCAPGPTAAPKPAVVADDLSFANGITRRDDHLYVAETRAARIAVFEGALAGNLRRVGHIALPGQPDNLTLDPEGHRLLAALLPDPDSLMLALFRLRGEAGIPSAAVAVPLADAPPDALFGDPGGQVISGATVAVVADGLLVLGSVVAPTLAVCPLAPPAPPPPPVPPVSR